MLVDIRNLTKIYRGGGEEIRALDDVSLGIEKGEFVSIIGQSGAGKSTLMNILGCLDLPDSGQYFLDGQDVLGASEKALAHIRNREIGFIFQGFHLIPSLNALENVELPLIYRGFPARKRRELAMEALERVGIGNRAKHRPVEMSGGQQQRVAIARAIAAKPPVILADEPTGNLDSQSGQAVMEILRLLHREGRTLILITHDQSLALTAQRLVRIQNGQVAEDRRLS